MKFHYHAILSTLILVYPVSVYAGDSQSLNIGKNIVIAQNSSSQSSAPKSATSSVQDVPMGQGLESSPNLLPGNTQKNDVDESLFGLPGGGYVHPFLGLSTEYTDNLFNVNTNKTSNLLSTITPGIWLAVPQLKEAPTPIVTNNTSAGGLQMALPDSKGFERFNTYLLGSTDFKNYSHDSDLNDYGARLEGLFKYNLRGGLSFSVMNSFNRSQDRFDGGNINSTNKLRQYYSNLVLSDIDWKFSEKFQTKLEYSNFLLNYNDDSVNFMDRKDNSGSLYGIYNYSVKTALFLQYQYVDVSYDSSGIRDNTQNFIYGGIDWKSTEKTSLNFKVGTQNRDLKDDTIDETTDGDSDKSGLALELALQYQIREKTKVALSVHRKIDESDSQTAESTDIVGGVLRYEQQFSERINGTCDFSYEHADYNQFINYGARKDDLYGFRPAVQYAFRDWLMFELAYKFESRDSSEDIYNYDTNTIFLSANAAL
jgi:polysaccharide biosynthesis protein VpsM